MYQAELKELGLTDNESKVYLALLQFGTLSPTKLAEKTGLHRSYIYDTLERLLERGIVNTLLLDNRKTYQAVDPKALREIFELKLRQLDSILPQLLSLFSSNLEETRVELHRGKRVYLNLIKDLIADLKKKDTVYLIGVDEKILETVEPIYLKQYFTIIKERNVKEKIIIASGSKKVQQKNIEYKELDKKYLGDTTTVVYQNKVYLFIWGNPHYLIVINSAKVSNNYLKQFNLFWEVAK